MPISSLLRYLKPSLTEQFRTRLPPAEVLRRMQASIARPVKPKWIEFSTQLPAEPFKGTVSANGFELQRIIDYRNSMVPRITGQVVPAPSGGSLVYLSHQLHPFTLVFACIWLFVVGSISLAVVQNWFSSREIGLADLIPLGMLVFGVCLFTIPFWLEVRQSRPQLLKLLELQEVIT
ncbi:MAG: hypothetical protein ACRYFX_25065 [Janthinobacterium lividum]